MTVELAKGVHWVGVVDWALRLFHGHELSTHRGSSYNSYLIVDDRIALVDTVWDPFSEELIANLKQVTDPAKIDYIIVNHAEVDHAGALPGLLRHCPDAQVLASTRGVESVKAHYGEEIEVRAVKTGDRISLGANELLFFEAPMLHWPDSMFTYLTGKNILMPNDAFGQHYATDFRFNDQVNNEELYTEALKYYANIITPFSNQVTRRIDELLALNLQIDMIAPSHGIIWRDNPAQIVAKYKEWAEQRGEERAVILYDTMWEATRQMADAIAHGMAGEGVAHKIFHMAVSDRNDVLTEIFKARAVVIGSPTINNGIMPTITPILEDIRGLKFKNKIGAAFGTYGWSGESVRRIEEHLGAGGIDVAAEGVRAKWRPKAEDLEACRALGRSVALQIKQR